jgi:hypothetical protein
MEHFQLVWDRCCSRTRYSSHSLNKVSLPGSRFLRNTRILIVPLGETRVLIVGDAAVCQADQKANGRAKSKQADQKVPRTKNDSECNHAINSSNEVGDFRGRACQFVDVSVSYRDGLSSWDAV